MCSFGGFWGVYPPHLHSFFNVYLQFKEILEQCLNYAEAGDYLSFTPDPSSKVSLFGLSPGDIQANNPYKKVRSAGMC